MTPDELRKRCIEFLESLRLDPLSLLSNNMASTESLCREMIVEGLERAAVIAGDGVFISDASAEARFGKECAGAIRREAQRVKENHGTKEAGSI